jgi:cbb3-type cytochrome oxidase maturation protein
MSSIVILIVVSLCIAGGFLGAFIWSVKSDLYEDQRGAAMRMLHDDADYVKELPKS